MTSDTLIGKALDEAVEAALGDDLSCGENRERIEAAIRDADLYLGHHAWGTWGPGSVTFDYPSDGTGRGDYLEMWDGRYLMTPAAREFLMRRVMAYRAEPRPFHRDLVLAMGLLDCDYQIEHERDRGLVTAWAESVMGQARYAEFPDAKDDDERRVLCLCAAICRSVLRAKEDGR